MRREVTARIKVSRFARLLSRVRRMSAGENNEKTSSVDSGSSQNCTHLSTAYCRKHNSTYVGPIVVIGGDGGRLSQAKDALLEGELGVGSTHWSACHCIICASLVFSRWQRK